MLILVQVTAYNNFFNYLPVFLTFEINDSYSLNRATTIIMNLNF